jgi:N-acetylglutamate synthase-like GNAT family acetyltransferase
VAARKFLLRAPRPGDLGWVVQRHGELYAREFGWDERFEGLVAGIVAKFVARFDAQRERCWIAERGGRRVGAVFLVKKSPRVAQLRMLIVEPEARGLGIGARLVAECVAGARRRDYHKIVLWTQGNLKSARRIYKAAGFRLVTKAPHASFGRRLVGEYWELAL